MLDRDHTAEVMRANLAPGTSGCIHCSGCGFLITAGARCLIHTDADCPPFSFRSAAALLVLFREQWLVDVGSDPSELAWDLADDVWSRDPALDAYDVVTIVVGMLDC